MASLDGISFDVATRNVSRTILSSVGGFSQPARRQIRSLTDLLATIQRLDLEQFPGATLRYKEFLGEGISYKVSRCIHRSTRRVVAVKRIKLPSATADFGAFEKQVATVLRDVEVMSCLRKNSNILNIFGYGWDMQSGSVIPFLVTDFAAEGTIREYLRQHKITAAQKLRLCQDIAQGLHSLHLCGVAHGDLKLDNILITPALGTSSGPNNSGSEETESSLEVVACLSDFGHSLHLYDKSDESSAQQRYGGTLAYNAPEIAKSRAKDVMNTLDFTKCDVWALGLVFWEIWINGHSYRSSLKVQEVVTSSQQRSRSTSVTLTNNPTPSSTTTLVDDLFLVAPLLGKTACDDIAEKISSEVPETMIFGITQTLLACLEADESKRVGDILSLSFVFPNRGGRIRTAPVQRANPTWSFEIFRSAHKIPYAVKTKLVHDFERAAVDRGRSDTAGKAAFQTAMAYLTGFGVPPDPEEAIQWFDLSAAKGFAVAEAFAPLWPSLCGFPAPGPGQPNFLDLIQDEIVKAAHLSPLGEKLSEHFGKEICSPDSTEFEEAILSFIPDVQPARWYNVRRDKEAPIYACKVGCIGVFPRLHNFHLAEAASEVSLTSVLHWIAMLPTHKLDIMLTDVLDRVNSQGLDAIDQVAPLPQIIDSQLPWTLIGTPLNFAVNFACTKVIKELCRRHADPFKGVGNGIHQTLYDSPLHTAARYHRTATLSYFLPGSFVTNRRIPKRMMAFFSMKSKLDFASYALSSALPIERELVLGSKYLAQEAAVGTIELLFDRYEVLGLAAPLWQMLEPMLVTGDLDLAHLTLALQGAFQNSTLSVKDRNKIMLRCTESACSGSFDKPTSIKLLQFALTAGADLNCSYPFQRGRRPIHIAIGAHQKTIFEWFLFQGVNLDALDTEGNTSLHHAVLNGFSAIYDISYLIGRGGSPIIPNNANITPLHLAMLQDDIDDIKTLLNHALRQEENLDYTLFLDQAITMNNPQLFLLILDEVRNVIGEIDLDLASSLCLAAATDSTDITKIILASGVDARKLNSDGQSALHLAALRNNRQVLRILLDEGVPVDTLNKDELSPLMFSMMYLRENPNQGCESLLDLIEAGADLNFYATDGSHILGVLPDLIENSATIQLVETLFRHGADPGSLWSDQRTPVYEAAILLDNFHIATTIINEGVLAGHKDIGSSTALHILASKAKYSLPTIEPPRTPLSELSYSLLHATRDLLCEDEHGSTALEIAASSDNGQVTSMILSRLQITSANKLRLRESFLVNCRSPEELLVSLGNDKALHTVARSWNQAVNSCSWSAICSFIGADLNGTLEFLDIAFLMRVFEFALWYNVSSVISRFTGLASFSRSRAPLAVHDPRLSAIWNNITEHLAQNTDMETATGAMRHLSNSCYLKMRSRLEYYVMMGGYVPPISSQELANKNFIEAQVGSSNLESAEFAWCIERLSGTGLIEVVSVDLGDHSDDADIEAASTFSDNSDPASAENKSRGIWSRFRARLAPREPDLKSKLSSNPSLGNASSASWSTVSSDPQEMDGTSRGSHPRYLALADARIPFRLEQ